MTKRFYSKKEDDLVEFARRCEEELGNLEEVDLKIEQVEETMIKVADSCLKREVTVVKRNRVKSNSRKVDRLNKERRELNKMRRKEADMGRREDLWKKYLKKKEEVQKAVALLLREEESREIDRMRKDKDVEIWRKINRLFGKERKAKEIKIAEEGLVMEKERANRIMVEFWKSLYWRDERKIGLGPSSDDKEE